MRERQVAKPLLHCISHSSHVMCFLSFQCKNGPIQPKFVWHMPIYMAIQLREQVECVPVVWWGLFNSKGHVVFVFVFL